MYELKDYLPKDIHNTETVPTEVDDTATVADADDIATDVDDVESETENTAAASATPPVPAEPRDGLSVTARIISYLFSPLLMPTYGMSVVMWLSLMTYFVDPGVKWMLLGITFSVTAALPVIAIFILWKLGVIHNPSLNARRDRLIPYIVSALCYTAMGIYLNGLHAAGWLSAFMYGGAVAILIDMTVNIWWKISGHATGMGGLTALLFFLMYRGLSAEIDLIPFGVCIIVSALVCMSRMILGRHTLMQLGAGYLCGFTCIYVATLFALL